MDYEEIGYDKFLRREFNPIAEITEDEAQAKTPQIPTSTVKGNIPKEQIQLAINNISQVSQTTTASYAGLLNGQTVTLTSTLSDITYPDKVMVAVCEVTAYDGALGVTASIIRPSSSWSIDQGFDFHTNALLASNGKSLTYFHSMLNESGSTKTIYWYIRWRFIGTNTAGET